MDTSNLPSLLEPLGIASLVGSFVVAILRAILKGQLIPRKTHEDRIKDRDQQIEFYKTAYGAEKQRSTELIGMVRSLMEVGSTTEHVVQSLREVALGTGGEHGSPVEQAPQITSGAG